MSLRRIVISILLLFESMVSLAASRPLTAPRASLALPTSNPFVIQESDGQVRGIYREYLTELMQKAGFDPHFEAMPLTRVLHYATKGTYDFFMGVSGLPEAGSRYIEVVRFHKIKVVLIGLVKKLDFGDGPLVIGKELNTYCPVFTKEQEKKVQYYEYKDTHQALKMLVAKRISAICTTRELFYFELQHSSFPRATFNELSDFQYEFVISLFANKRVPSQKLKSVTKAVTELEQKKLLSTLYKKYGLEEVPKP